MYEKLGFKVIGRRRGYYTDDGEDAVVMWSDSLLAPAFQERFNQLRERYAEEIAFSAYAGD
jgi:ribosomal-protein-alanine N-acetyltransferase